MPIKKSLRGLPRYRIAFFGQPDSSVPFNGNGETLLEALKNGGYTVELEDRRLSPEEFPDDLSRNGGYQHFIGWVYIPENADLGQLARLCDANGWVISYYNPNQKGRIIIPRSQKRISGYR